MKHIATFFTFFCILRILPLNGQQWEQFTAPNDGWLIQSLHEVEGTLFVGAVEKLYRSQDGGDSWTFNHILYNQGFSYVEVNRNNNRFYITGPSIDTSGLLALYETKDLGDTWTYLGPTPGLQWFFIGDSIYTFKNGKIFRRINNTSWQALPSWPGNNNVGSTRKIKASGQHIYALTSKGIFHSPDAGNTWEISLNEDFSQTSNFNVSEMEALDQYVVARVAYPNRLYVSDDYGATWQETPSEGGRLFNSGKHIFSIDSTEYKYLFRFNGSPQIWDSIPLYLNQAILLSGVGESQDGTYWLGTARFSVARKKTDSDLWIPVVNGLRDASLQSLRYYDERLFYSAAYDQTFSPDNGNTWQQRMNTGYINPNQIWSRGNYDYTWNNGLSDWGSTVMRCLKNHRFEWAALGDTPDLIRSMAATGDTLLSVELYDPFALYRSLDNGVSWNVLDSEFGGYTIRSWQGNFYILRDSALFRSEDAGTSWQKVYTFPHAVNEIVSVFHIVQDTFLVSYQPADRIYYSVDGGVSFSTLLTPGNPNTNLYRLRLHGRTFLLSMNDGLIFVSRDLGQTWLSFSPPTPTYNFDSKINNCTASDNAVFLYENWRLRFDGQRQVNGKVFLDLNSNGQKEAGEQGLNGWIVETAQNNALGVTYNDGDFSILLGLMNPDTLSVNNILPYYTASPAWKAVLPGDTQPVLFAIQPQGTVHDAAVQMAASQSFRAGYENTLHIDLKNVGTVSSSGQLKLALNPLLSVLNTTPPADVISGDTLVWNYSNLPPLQNRKYRVNVSTAVAPPGTQVLVRAEVLAGADADILNNVAILDEQIVSSYDPNAKSVSESQVPVTEADDEELIYTVRFQNLGNTATDFITVRDTLSGSLDAASIRVLTASHPYEWLIENGRVLIFHFNPIRLAPAADDSLRSQGFVQFAAKLRPGLNVGDEITNTAQIYFDFNPAIVTNTVVTSIQVVSTYEPPRRAHLLEIAPNPASARVTLRLPKDVSGITGRIEIFSAEGRLVYSATTQANSDEIELLNWKAGAYWCRWTASGAAYWGKMVVQH